MNTSTTLTTTLTRCFLALESSSQSSTVEQSSNVPTEPKETTLTVKDWRYKPGKSSGSKRRPILSIEVEYKARSPPEFPLRTADYEISPRQSFFMEIVYKPARSSKTAAESAPNATPSKAVENIHRKKTREQTDKLLADAMEFLKESSERETGSKHQVLADQVLRQAEKVVGMMKRADCVNMSLLKSKKRKDVTPKTKTTSRDAVAPIVAACFSTRDLVLLLMVLLLMVRSVLLPDAEDLVS